jgi:hypothetical protein
VVKLDANGAYQWHTILGGAGTQQGTGIETDAAGDPIVVGTFESQIVFPGETAQTGVDDVWVAKFDGASGQLAWREFYRGSGTDRIADVATTAGSVYVCGTFASDLMISTRTLTAGGTSAWVARLDDDGVMQWAREIESSLNTSCKGIAADSLGAVVTGDFTGTLALGAGPTASTTDAYVATIGPDACATGLVHFPGSDNLPEVGVGVALSGSDIYATGSFLGTVSFGSIDLTVSGAEIDIYLARLSRP